jgi:hypothetical protein
MEQIMKKIIFCIWCMLGSIAFVSAQEKVIKIDTVIPVQETCMAVSLSHWSFAIKGGVCNFAMYPETPTAADRYNPTIGAVIDYTINPLIGIGLEYLNNDYSRPYEYLNTTGKVKGGTNDFLLYGSVNLSNALAPFRSWKNLSFYANVGGGVAFYTYGLDDTPLKSNTAMMGKLGLNAEFTLNKALNLFLAGDYHQYDARNMGAVTHIRNCAAMVYTLGLRVKLGSSTSKHARNINLCEYTPEAAPIIVNKTCLKGDTDELINRVKTAEKENAASKLKIQQLEEEAKKAVK